MNKPFHLLAALLIALVAGFHETAHAQQEQRPTTIESMDKLSIQFGNEYKKTYAAKDYSACIDALNKRLSLLQNFEPQNENEKKAWAIQKEQKSSYLHQQISNIYYNLACSYSLVKKRDDAVKALDMAANYGFYDYRHALSDSDLINIRKTKGYRKAMEKIHEQDKLTILQKSEKYLSSNDSDNLPKFKYVKDDYHLKGVRKYFNLDSVTSQGKDEISKIICLLHFAHDAIRHDGSNRPQVEFDAIDIYNYCKATGRGVNCRLLAMALNEMYLSMGL